MPAPDMMYDNTTAATVTQSSTSAPSPQSVASSSDQPVSGSILLNPLQPAPRSASPSSPSLWGAPFRRAISASTSAAAGPSTSKRRPSMVAVEVEVVQSLPPSHFFQNDDSDDEDDSSLERRGRLYSSSPLRARYGGDPRSRSVSPIGTPASRSPERASTAGSSEGSSSASSTGTSEGKHASSVGGGSVKFAPLPVGRRPHRSNSLSIGVASRAKMIQAQGGMPDVRGARHAGPLQWYEGGPVPDDVYTWRDAQKGICKLFNRARGRSGSIASTASSSSGSSAGTAPIKLAARRMSSGEEEAKHMEREAKAKGIIEHIEEADEEEEEEEELAEEEGGMPATVDDEEGEEGETASEPRTPPQYSSDLEAERRRAAKGKGKVVVREESGGQPRVLS
ncbi:hypothetical protein JCM11641_000264 [Rhodosporidiobolus odoratus]